MKKWEYAQAMGLCEEAVDYWVEQCSECKTTAFSDEMCWHMATPICPSCFTALNEVTA